MGIIEAWKNFWNKDEQFWKSRRGGVTLGLLGISIPILLFGFLSEAQGIFLSPTLTPTSTMVPTLIPTMVPEATQALLNNSPKDMLIPCLFDFFVLALPLFFVLKSIDDTNRRKDGK